MPPFKLSKRGRGCCLRRQRIITPSTEGRWRLILSQPDVSSINPRSVLVRWLVADTVEQSSSDLVLPPSRLHSAFHGSALPLWYSTTTTATTICVTGIERFVHCTKFSPLPCKCAQPHPCATIPYSQADTLAKSCAHFVLRGNYLFLSVSFHENMREWSKSWIVNSEDNRFVSELQGFLRFWQSRVEIYDSNSNFLNYNFFLISKRLFKKISSWHVEREKRFSRIKRLDTIIFD